jgi:hypothetical protein
MAGPEAVVKRKVKAALKEIGAFQHWPVQSGMGAPILDCIACINGRYIAIETKAAGKHPTPRQHMLIEQIEQAGGWTYVIDGDVSIAAMLEDLKCL